MILEAAQRNDAEAVIREMRVRSLMWPYYFVKVVLGYEDLVHHLHGVEMERFITNIENKIYYQWIEWPRKHFKTTCFTIGCGIWFVLPVTPEDTKYAIEVLKIEPEVWHRRVALHNQDYCQLIAFESGDNAARKLVEIKTHFEQNELFRTIFPEIAYQKTAKENPWSTQAIKIRRSPRGYRVGEATFQALGVGAAVQSQHYDIIWEDDIVGKDATEQPTVMASTIRWHGLLNGAMGGPNRKADTIRIGVSNCWGYSDVNSHVRKHEPHYVFHRRSIVEFDETTGKDEPIFPERYSQERMDIERRSMTKYDWACQMMNQPMLEGDQRVDLGRVHRYTVNPETGEIICSCGYKTFSSHLTRYMHYDPYNAKGVRSTSAPAIAVVGLSMDKHVFLLDYFIAKADYNKIFDKLVEYNDIWWPDMMTYEDVGNQNMCEQYLKTLQRSQEFKTAKRMFDGGTGHRVFRRILPVTTRGVPKERRIMDWFFPVIELQKFACRATHQTFLTMLETFPSEMPDHDYDLLDCLSQGPAVWRFPADEEKMKQEKRAEDAYVANIGKSYGYTSRYMQ